MRQSIAEADSHSTIYFPDDDVELGPYRKSFSRDLARSATLSPSSSTSTYTPQSPITATTLPPSYVNSTYLDAAASTLHEYEKHKVDNLRPQSLGAVSWVTLPDMIIETPESFEHVSRPSSYSSYSSPSVTSHTEQDHYGHEEEEDGISITDAYMDSRPTSPSLVQMHPLPVRALSPQRVVPLELPMPPPPALAFHRPFSPPSVYPVSHAQSERNANGSNGSINGIVVTVHMQSSRESL